MERETGTGSHDAAVSLCVGGGGVRWSPSFYLGTLSGSV